MDERDDGGKSESEQDVEKQQHGGDEERRQQNFDSITFSYLKRHYFDADALRRRTMDEFVQAMRTGRMIAFTGSMTTEDRGYSSWDEFVASCFQAARSSFERHETKARSQVAELRQVVEKFEEFGNEARPPFRLDKRVSFSIIGETVDVAAHYSRMDHVNPNKEISDKEFLVRKTWKTDKTVLETLLHDLNIDRTITLNYDLEAELEYSHRAPPRDGDGLNALGALGNLDHDPASGSIIKRLPGARSLVSDIFNRERTDRLIEFAVGSADHEYHVLHLHGRADAFDSMVVSYRDYDRLYRRGGLSKAPFEHALQLLFAGNPILFVGIGMTEADVNRTLHDYVGNHPYRRVTPTFLLWNSYGRRDEGGNPVPGIDQDACDVFRLDMLHRLGVLTIFSHELEGADEGEILAPKGNNEERRMFNVNRLRNAIALLARDLQARRDRRMARVTHWRSMASRVRQAKGLITAWEVESHAATGCSAQFKLDELTGKLSLAIGPAGVGKGGEARGLADAWLRAHPTGTVLLLNADFCFDTDGLLNLVGDFIKARREAEGRRIPDGTSRNETFRLDRAFTLEQPALIVLIGVERLFGTNGEPLSAEFDEMLRRYVRCCAAPEPEKRATIGIVVFTTPRAVQYFQGIGWCSDSAIELQRRQDAKGPSRYMASLGENLKLSFNPVSGLIVEDKRRTSLACLIHRGG
ncbi:MULTISPECIES: SIR2 family protein [unclassified Sphingomonas]|uniref:SIR2 family protein n=1 Tax=Novosphingobium rhizosphaerae TaxID=1551649 RepID=UPI0015CEB6EB